MQQIADDDTKKVADTNHNDTTKWKRTTMTTTKTTTGEYDFQAMSARAALSASVSVFSEFFDLHASHSSEPKRTHRSPSRVALLDCDLSVKKTLSYNRKVKVFN
jgi:hypothetical protein